MARYGFALAAVLGAAIVLIARAGKREQPDEYVLGGDGWVFYDCSDCGAEVYLA